MSTSIGSAKKILVTGGTGFLGAYVIRELIQKNYTVRAIRRSAILPFFIEKNILEKVEWVAGDILDPVSMEEAMAGVDGVIHAAAKISYRGGEQKEVFQANINGTATVVNAALAQNISRFIHISSVAALGRQEHGELVTEGQQWEENKLSTNYAISKYQGEMEVWRAIAEGLNAVILNPSTNIGYGDWNESSCAIFKSVYREFPWYTNGINGFVAVKDVAAISVLMLASTVKDERFIVSGDNCAFRGPF